MSEMSNEKKETVMDIVTEMRNEGNTVEVSSLEWWVCEKMFYYAERIEAAFDRLAVPTPEQWTEIARHGAEIADLKRENARLRAALEPVLDVALSYEDGEPINLDDGEVCTDSEYTVSVNGNPIDDHTLAGCLAAVREAQRIYITGDGTEETEKKGLEAK